jgi:hypothetical protein
VLWALRATTFRALQNLLLDRFTTICLRNITTAFRLVPVFRGFLGAFGSFIIFDNRRHPNTDCILRHPHHLPDLDLGVSALALGVLLCP